MTDIVVDDDNNNLERMRPTTRTSNTKNFAYKGKLDHVMFDVMQFMLDRHSKFGTKMSTKCKVDIYI